MSIDKIPEEVFYLDRSHGATLQAQIREAVVSAVLDGRMLPAARLPSTRKLALHLKVSRITVTQAYQELVSQGYLEASARSSFQIAQGAPDRQIQTDQPVSDSPTVDWSTKLSGQFNARRLIEKPDDWRIYAYPFIYGQMDMTVFHHGAWRESARRALTRRDFESSARDAAASDDAMLVNYICSRTLPRRGITAEPNELLVTVGAQNALWLTIQLLARDGLNAVVENPGYPDIANALRYNGAKVSAVDIDQHGLPPEKLPADTEAVFVTPSHQAPTAVTMPIERRTQLLKAADQRDFVIVEDDYEFEMSFLKPPSPALKSLDRNQRVIYVGSFSKALFPGLRLGYLVGPEAFIDQARKLRSLILRHPPGPQQRTVAYFMALGHYDSLIRDMRKAFAERREVMTHALDRAGIDVMGAASFGGSNFWVKGPDRLDSLAFASELRQDGVLIEPGTPFFDNNNRPIPFFRMAYSSIPVEKIEEGISRIAKRLASTSLSKK